MCGIVGYLGPQDAAPILLEGLRRLEYRGYDSAGISVISEEGALTTLKKQGRISVLEEAMKEAPLRGSCGIAHTRWATHGAPTE
ncbi:MAG: glutamine--fructose-6-phosphate aminotransferase, partial [Gemmatimonadales bacterium]